MFKYSGAGAWAGRPITRAIKHIPMTPREALRAESHFASDTMNSSGAAKVHYSIPGIISIHIPPLCSVSGPTGVIVLQNP